MTNELLVHFIHTSHPYQPGYVSDWMEEYSLLPLMTFLDVLLRSQGSEEASAYELYVNQNHFYHVSI